MATPFIQAALAAEVPSSEKLVLLALASYANHLGLSWPSVETLVRRTALSRSTVFRALARLEQVGAVWRYQQRDPNDPKRRKVTNYVLHLGNLTKLAPGSSIGVMVTLKCHGDTEN